MYYCSSFTCLFASSRTGVFVMAARLTELGTGRETPLGLHSLSLQKTMYIHLETCKDAGGSVSLSYAHSFKEVFQTSLLR